MLSLTLSSFGNGTSIGQVPLITYESPNLIRNSNIKKCFPLMCHFKANDLFRTGPASLSSGPAARPAGQGPCKALDKEFDDSPTEETHLRYR